MDSPVLGCLGFCVFFWVCVILFAVSFAVVEPLEMGIKFNGNTQHYDASKIHDEGRYLAGLGQWFILFPRTYQELQITAMARTVDGMPVQLNVAYQYLLPSKSEDLIRFYQDFGEEREVYDRHIRLVSEATTRDAASHWEAFDFFVKRFEIAEDIHESLTRSLSDLFIKVPAFQLINIEFDTQFADAIEDTEVAKQDVEQAQNEQQIVLVSSLNTVDVAKVVAENALLVANATAKAVLVQAENEAAILKYKLEQQAISLANLRDKLDLVTNEGLLGYTWLTSIQEAELTELLLGLQIPSQFK